VARGGEVAWVGTGGMADREAGTPMTADTVFRIYSMSKPITSVALMALFEQGLFNLDDPVAPLLGCFDEPRIFTGGTVEAPSTIAATEPIRIWHLLTHTAGLTYGFQYQNEVDALYRLAGYDFGSPKGADLAQACRDWAALPLLFEPGSRWNYSVATDVVGRLVEVLTGTPLDVALRDLVLDPLGMDETGFCVAEEAADRLAQLYIPDAANGNVAVAVPEMGQAARRVPHLLSGGGGLVSTPHDYRRFTHMLRNGGELDGVRVLGSRTLDYMTANHLPGGVDIHAITDDIFSETSSIGVGFGLGFATVLDATGPKTMTTEGSFYWGGAASTAFWVDPIEDLEVSFFTQLLPSSTHPLRAELSTLVYQAIED
jgi:CubicO group peptidase (beta-lactamase class C family)